MAEVVHRNLEAMVPQLEELEISGIFSHEEIRTIIKFRRNHEYQMVRRPAHKEDFLASIQYELHLDLLRKRRKKRLGITGTRHDADYGIQNRIHEIFRRAVKKFKGDPKLWFQYISFAKNSNHRLSLSKIYGRALAIHPNSTRLWVMAAKFQFEDLKDVTAARSLLQQGLRANQTSKHIWLEYFRMELMHTDKVRKRREVLGLEEGDVESKVLDEFLSYKVASVVLQEAFKAILSNAGDDDVEFRLSFLPILCLFADTQSLQDEVYDSVKNDFPLHAVTWDALARRHWVGIEPASLDACRISELEIKSEEIFMEGITSSVETAEEMEEGERTSKKPRSCDIWDKYFDWSVERLNECGDSETRVKQKQRIVTSFKQASSDGLLSIQSYEKYIELLESFGLHEDSTSALSSGLRAHPSSVNLWLVKLESVPPSPSPAHKTHKREKEMELLFKEALNELPIKDSLRVWELWLKRASDTEDVFKAGVGCGCVDISAPLASLYVDWTLQEGGITRARKTYKKLLASIPVSYSLYEKCIELEYEETSSGRNGMKRLRALFEKAIRDYGSVHIDLWLRYITAELHLDGGKVEELSKLHWRAVKELESSLTGSFIEQYSLLNTVGTTQSYS